jgi:hypothetical protein
LTTKQKPRNQAILWLIFDYFATSLRISFSCAVSCAVFAKNTDKSEQSEQFEQSEQVQIAAREP